MIFKKEAKFEDALIKVLFNKGWSSEVIMYPTEEDLIQNWANILFNNNQSIDRLNGCPLTSGEMQQIMEQIKTLRTPLMLNKFINGKTISITRDNVDDKLHFGKEVSLKIYDRKEIAAGQSRYQIARQPKFKASSRILNDRRGDIMLLINGMPVIHIELKRSGVPVSEACNQIQKYSYEGVFTGLFSLVQIFVAMTPDETLYFANPGSADAFNPYFYFHWADFNNEVINDWKGIASNLISIPMAHQLIGFYTVADDTDGVLKVMRSYQYYAASAISDKVSKTKWGEGNQRGGFIWHTTGSGKTMTSFKSAQLIANSKDADKVVFLTDRIELGNQSYIEYNNFADDGESVQKTEDTYVLITKLKSSAPADTLIVTSIQKMSNIKNDENGLNAHDIEEIGKKRIVFIVDECHRSTFGEMLSTIKSTFPNAIFFGFTGTPIFEENQKKMSQTSTIFGGELHRYVLADGIRDKNVLGFDPRMVQTFKENDVRKQVALAEAKANNVEEAFADEKKREVFNKYMNDVPMAGYENDDGKYVKGVEDYLPNSQYIEPEHQNAVVNDICDNWSILSVNKKFHAIFATSSIPEAIEYYGLFKDKMPSLKVTCLFDPHISNEDGEYKNTYKGKPVALFKEDGLVKILNDYNDMFGQDFTIPTHASFKKDVSLRLAHKEKYSTITRTPEKMLDLLIVVDQMLTGFDSKWVNTLYMDKILQYENLIQAMSRTNRLFKSNEKPYGVIKYYRRPFTMRAYIDEAVKTYSGDKPTVLFVEKLPYNLKKLNVIYMDISEVFKSSGVSDFTKLPNDHAEKAKFAQLFKDFNHHLDAAKLQGFNWEQDIYTFNDEETGLNETIKLDFGSNDFMALVQRYKELSNGNDDENGNGGSDGDDVPFDLVGYITEIDTGRIDAAYMNSRFEKYLKNLHQADITEEQLQASLDELHKSFATLTQDEQKYAEIFLHDVQRGEVVVEDGKTLRDYITEYQYKAKNDQIHSFAVAFGLDEDLLKNMMQLNLTEANIDEFGRFDKLKQSVNKAAAKAFLEKIEGKVIIPPKVNMKVDKILRKFILTGGFDPDEG
ncbi:MULTISPECIES: type I restriction endonuclease subunit R, EcoR124 family [unclassified Ruminococcus]|uniref:type I restriction endonuclease subunit R, EcoR124 family n=1 Tax=unclassified Ruminococcus TaxID=2608920 RepID=UPI0034A3A617